MTGSDDSPLISPTTLDGSTPPAARSPAADTSQSSRLKRPSLKHARQHVSYPSTGSPSAITASPVASPKSSQPKVRSSTSKSSEGGQHRSKRHGTIGSVPYGLTSPDVRSDTLAASPYTTFKTGKDGSKMDSPTFEATGRSPAAASDPTGSAGSNKSSGSSRTVVAPSSMSGSGSGSAARTPSYPFPHVPTPPGKTRPMRQGHSTSSSMSSKTINKPRQGSSLSRHASFSSTPSTAVPGPTPTAASQSDHSDFPSPDMNKLVLQLNSDPDLEYWWGVVCEAMRDWYRASRLSLAIPADSNDIENVPWGQKASFDSSGLRDHSEDSHSSQRSNIASSTTGSSRGQKSDISDTPGPVTSVRGDSPSDSKSSDPGARHTSFTHSHAAQTPSDAPSDAWNLLSPTSEGTTQIYTSLRPLDAEMDTLLDAGGVLPVLERGRTVVLSREYSSPDGSATPEIEETKSTSDEASNTRDSDKTPRSSFRKSSMESGRIHSSTDRVTFKEATAKFRSSTRRPSNYEEYEQIPASPWWQSPAPSPAIQADSEENPFFATGTLDEESFATPTREDYSGQESVEAIGIDQGVSTVIHVPLIHPLLSRLMANPGTKQEQPAPSTAYRSVDATDRRAPIAILSLQAAVVPYPRALLESLDQLAPHLATSFHTANLTTARILELNGRKNLVAGRGGLGNLLQLDLDDSNSSTGLASPSDHSTRSISGTPLALDPWASGTSGKPYPTGIPGAASVEAADSYFDSKRMSLSRAHSTGYVPQMHSLAANSSAQAAASRPSTAENRSVSKIGKVVATQATSPAKKEKRPSVLHSRGADFASSFPSLPVTAVPHTPGSQPNEPEMAPPSDRLLRTIIDSLPVQIFTAAPDSGFITYVNSKFLVYRGQSPFHGTQTPRQVLAIHEEDLEAWLHAWDRSLRTGQEFQQKVRLRRFDGSYRWFYIKTAFLRDRQQKVVHIIGTCMDIHEQYMAEISATRAQETAASEAKYRALANSSPQIVFAATRKKGVTFCNTQWLRYAGQSEEDAIGSGFMDHVHPDDIIKCKLPSFDGSGSANVPVSVTDSKRYKSFVASPGSAESEDTNTSAPTFDTSVPQDMPQRKLSQLAGAGIMKVSQDESGKPSYSTEVRLRNKSGDYRWHLVRVLLADPLINDGPEEETWFGSCADINDHKELEKTLKETMDAKSRFLSNMSHEIRTPLNGIHGMSQILIDSANLTMEQMEHLNVIRASTEGLRDLINDILDLSKVEAGMITLTKDWLQIRSIVEEVNDMTTPLIMEKNIDLNYIVDQDVPSAVLGDRFRIRQVLLNIIGNAIKFTQNGEVLVRCGLTPNLEGSQDDTVTLQFDVMDTGRGFSDKEAERLFKRFSQIDGSSTRQHGGSGLGLVISMQLVELHGGTMTARGFPGKGSTFTFTINVGVGHSEQKAEQQRRSESEAYVPPRLLFSNSSDSASSVVTQSPGQLDTTSLSSSGSSDPMIQSSNTSLPSKSSSSSSVAHDPKLSLNLPSHPQSRIRRQSKEVSSGSVSSEQPAMLYSVIVVCPLQWARESAMKHLENALPAAVPHQVTFCVSVEECLALMHEQGVVFSHIVAILQDSDALMRLVDDVLSSPSHSMTSIIAVTGLSQKQAIVEQYSNHNFTELAADGKLRFIFKPLKVSKLSETFDPQKSKGLSTDLHHNGSQRVAKVQKKIFDDMAERLGNKGHRVLLVEDNKINQLVILKLLKRTSIEVDTALDGKQCTDKFFGAKRGHYSIILCDLHMPVKDGYQTCTDIRKFEKNKNWSNVPIIALSANVLGDVYAKCAAAGFNSYLTKPVEFKDLSELMTAFLDRDPDEPLEFMQSPM